jgi:hypothetical protein
VVVLGFWNRSPRRLSLDLGNALLWLYGHRRAGYAKTLARDQETLVTKFTPGSVFNDKGMMTTGTAGTEGQIRLARGSLPKTSLAPIWSKTISTSADKSNAANGAGITRRRGAQQRLWSGGGRP